MFCFIRSIILKFIFFVLTFLLIVGTFLSNNVYADGTLYTEGDFQYYIIDSEGGIRIAKYIGDDAEVYVPYSFGLYEVKAIDSGAFTETGVQKVHVYDNVTLIGANAFDEGTELVVQTVNGEASTNIPNVDGDNDKSADDNETESYYSETSVKLNSNEGNYPDGSTSITIIAKYDDYLPDVDVLPTREGYTFLGFYFENTIYINDKGKSEKKWDKSDKETYTLFAHWMNNETGDKTVVIEYEDITDDISEDFDDSDDEELSFFERLFGNNDDETTAEKDRKKVRNRLFEIFDANNFASDFKAKPVGYFIIIFSIVSIIYLVYHYFRKR